MKSLIVSDDELFAHLAAKKLEDMGYRVTIELTAAAACERIKKEPFRVVITGWNFCDQGMTGPELCEHIRALNRGRHTHIIIYTYKCDKGSMMVAFEAGADDYLIRPFNALELKMRLAKGKWLRDLEDDLWERAIIDSVIGWISGSSFKKTFRATLAQTRWSGSKGALMFVTINNYHEIFSEFGCDSADRLMVEVSRILTGSIRDTDLVAKVSDNEFSLLLQNTFWDKCSPVAEKITAQTRNAPIVDYELELHTHAQVSIGTINYPLGDLSTDEILVLPDRIAYQP